MITAEVTPLHPDQTIAQARAARTENALAAAFYANRVEFAQASARNGAAERWYDEYRRSAARCRLLGEMIRSERVAA